MNKTRRMLAILLALCLTAGAVPFAALSATTEEELANRKNSGSSVLLDTTVNAVSDYVATAAADVGSNKPADGTNANQPFPTSIMNGGHYRIPALVTLSDGTLVAAADARWHAWDDIDDNGDIDTIVSYSKDNGANWGYSFANYIDNGNTTNYNAATFIDPALAAKEIDGVDTVFMIVDLYPGQESQANCTAGSQEGTGYDSNGNLLLKANASATSFDYYVSGEHIFYKDGTQQTGYTVDEYFNLYSNGTFVDNLFNYSTTHFQPLMTSHLYMTKGTMNANGELEWSAPVMLNPQVKTDSSTDRYYLVSPGRGLVTSDGTIIFGCYDANGNGNASIIYSNDNGVTWNRSETVNGTSSENEIVELSDGTLRMFIRHYDSDYTLKYVDATKQGDGTYTWGTIQSTGIVAHNNTNITAIAYSKTYNGEQVILVSCPGSTGGAWTRENGKVFTFTNNESTKAMTLMNTYEVNGAGEGYSYSCLTEQSDGSIGLLYEKGDSGNITYINLNAETVTGLTFDIPDKIYVADSDTNQEISALTMYTFNGAQTYSVRGVSAGQTIAATSDNTAVVTVAVSGSELTLTPVAPGTAKITVTVTNPVTRSTTAATIELAVTVQAEETKNITVKVGQSVTLEETTGDYTASDKHSGPANTGVATMELNGGSVAGGKKLVAVTEIESGKQYLLKNNRAGGLLTGNAASSYNNTSGLLVDGSASVDSTELWTITSEGSSYTLQINEKYLSLTNITEMSDSEATVNLTYVNDYWLISQTNAETPHYLSDLYGDSWKGAAGYTVLDDAGNYWTIYEIVEEQAGTYTQITFTGVAAGNTTAKVGNTNYNITVVEDVRNVTVYPGDSLTDTIDGFGYTEANVTERPSASIAEMTVQSVSGELTYAVSDEPITEQELAEGTYLIRADDESINYASLDMCVTSIVDTQNPYGSTMLTNVDNNMVPNGTNMWTLEASETGYKIRSEAGYINLGTGTNTAVLDAKGEVFTFKWNSNTQSWAIQNPDGIYFNLLGNDMYGYRYLGGWTGDGSNFELYKVTSQSEGASTEVTFTGKTAGTTTTAKVGHVTYNITVKEPPKALSKEATPFVGNTGTQGLGQAITSMVITAGTSYDLDILADKFPGEVTWSADNGRVTVDENGTVTGVSAGESAVTATINGVSYTIPVTVLPGDDASVKRVIDVYNITTIDCTAYYSYNCGPLVEFPEGTLLYIENSMAETDQITFFGKPNDGYILTYMTGTGGKFFHPVRNAAGTGYGYESDTDSCSHNLTMKTDGTSYLYAHDQLIASAVNNASAATADQVDAMLGEAVGLKCDGAFLFSRATSHGNIGTQTTFIADKLPEINKAVEGILPISRKQADYRRYYEGMLATADERIFFKVTITQERPDAWEDETNGEAALKYTNAVLTDILPGAYFYTKELDEADDLWDGEIAEENRSTELDITDALNEAWGADESVRVLEYYVMYEITQDDIPKYTITNTVVGPQTEDENKKFKAQSDYSLTPVEINAKTDASITVVQKPLPNVIIDFTQPFTISGLANEYLKFAYVNGDKTEKYPVYEAKYGTVELSKEIEGYDTNGEPLKDNDGEIRYIYTLTYMPDPAKGIMQEPDVVKIYGTFFDKSLNEQVEKMINSFVVYPATTVYYEEDYVTWNGWDGEGTPAITGQQTLDYAGDAVKEHNYGYDPMYEVSNGASNGTQATTQTIGAAGTFDFTGTGFEIYANCTENTGYVMVLVKSKSGQIRLYTVNTQVGAGSSAATNQQGGTYYSVPIVSVQGLEHGEYNVRIVKSTDYDAEGKPIATAKPVNIDAVRIFQTMDPATSNQVYTVDGERDPQFVELRDLVLTGANIAHKEADGEWEYSTAANIVSQVYSDTGSLNAVVWLNNPVNPSYATQDNLQDLLENGPKNELYLWPGQAVTFTLSPGVTAQIGMKTVSGNKVDYSYTDSSGEYPNQTLNSSTDMFYHNPSTGAVTIINTDDSGVLSITLLKYWNATTETLLAEVSESQIAYALMSLRELPAKEAVLHVTAVDYTGEEVGSVRLSKPGAEGEYAVFTREELLAQLPDGYLPVDEVIDIQVAYGEELAVTARIGKVATLKVEYVRLYKHGEVDMGGTRVPVMGKKTVTETLTKVQTGTGDAVFTAQEIWAAAPAGAVLHGLGDIQVAYGQTELISVFDTQSANAQVVPSIKL